MGKFLHIFSIYISLIMCLLILDIVEGLYDVNILIAILCFQKKKKRVCLVLCIFEDCVVV
jgi:hypothetical protein